MQTAETDGVNALATVFWLIHFKFLGTHLASFKRKAPSLAFENKTRGSAVYKRIHSRLICPEFKS